MQLCHFEIGEQVILAFNNTDSVIRTVWPTSERSLTSVTTAPMVSGISKNILKEGCRIKVQKLPVKPLPASFIHLSTSAEIGLDSVDQLITTTKQLYSGKVLKRGLEVNVSFYGMPVDMIVKDIVPIKCAIDNNLEDQLEKLNINKYDITDQYFMVVDASKWTIALKIKNNEKKVNNKNISLSDIGGYKELIQELVRSTSTVLKKTSSSRKFIFKVYCICF
ncbi:spermatogenesis associated protein 5 [Homalodisca vitripennis]|nr:spermatogenesis associated protein 5 [Homalodisca vitripennis]